jgi:uncharacterized protein (DUF1501 family)
MKRRDLLGKMMFASVAAGVLPLSFPTRALAAACSSLVPQMPRTLVNVMLNGGADLRFLFMPLPVAAGGGLSAEHEALLYSARRDLYASSRSDPDLSYAQMFALEYVVPSGQNFGIHKSCGWLATQFEEGNVAVIANAYCSRNRRHDQSILNADAGEPEFDELVFDRDGWGGRLVEEIGAGSNAVELGGTISVFNKGTEDGNRLAQVIHAASTRNIALPDVTDGGKRNRRDSLIRALKGYYSARGQEVLVEKPVDWPYHAFFDHNSAFRAFGDDIAARMVDCGALPPSLLPPSAGGSFDLANGSFEQQCRNLYDVCLAPDLLNLRTLSMSYGGWDTHNNEEVRISANLSDIFGGEGGLARATSEIAGLDSNAKDQLVFYFASDFGRQIVANGDLGTDHGRGTYSIVLGSAVKGGVYGDMFPESEAVEANGKVPLDTHGADIFGQTSTENILAEVCEWMAPGSSGRVFPGAGPSTIEPGVSLAGLVA